jgi:hypothetical protein
MKTTPWIIEDGYCALRCIDGTDSTKLENRVAFIEKTPRIRVHAFTDSSTDWKNWREGPKGSGGGDPAEDLTYGYDPRSRAWCDEQLLARGYTLGAPAELARSNKPMPDTELTTPSGAPAAWGPHWPVIPGGPSL